MGWKTVLGTASVLVTAAGGGWWAMAAPPAPVIGPAIVVTPANGASRPSASATPVVPRPGSASPAATGDGESPKAVDPQWVRPVDDDDGPGPRR